METTTKSHRIYTVKIEETLARTVEIEARNALEAEEKIRNMYRNEDIILTSEDYFGTDFSVCENEKVRNFSDRDERL